MTDRWRHREPETLRMNFQNRPLGWALLPEGIRGMFNLNDPRWGRGEDKSDDAAGPPDDRPGTPPARQRGDDKRPGRPRRSRNTAPPDLDEILPVLNRKRGGLFGGKNGAGRGPGSGGNGGGSGGGFQPDMKSAGVGVGL